MLLKSVFGRVCVWKHVYPSRRTRSGGGHSSRQVVILQIFFFLPWIQILLKFHFVLLNSFVLILLRTGQTRNFSINQQESVNWCKSEVKQNYYEITLWNNAIHCWIMNRYFRNLQIQWIMCIRFFTGCLIIASKGWLW